MGIVYLKPGCSRVNTQNRMISETLIRAEERWQLILGALGLTALLVGTMAGVVILGPEYALHCLAASLVLATILIFLPKPERAVWIILILLFFGNRSELSSLFFFGRYLPTLGVGLFFLCSSMYWLVKGSVRPAATKFILGYGLFLSLLSVSSFVNQSDWVDTLLATAVNLRYPVFFILLVLLELRPEFYRRVTNWFLALTLLQMPLCLIQFSMGLSSDSLKGTMGSNGALIAATLSGQTILLSRWLASGRHPLAYVSSILLLTIPSLVGDIQFGLVAFPIIATYLTLRHTRSRITFSGWIRAAVVLFLFMGLVAGAVATTPMISKFLSVRDKYLSHLLNFRDPSIASFASMGRITIIPLSLPFLLEEPHRLLWGFGPEATQGALLTGALDDSPSDEISLQRGIVCQKLMEIGSFCREPQSFRSLMEFGFLGTALFVLPMFSLRRLARRMTKKPLPPSTRSMVILFDGISLFYIYLAFWYIPTWRLDSYSFPFWLFAGALVAENRFLAARGRP